MGLFGLSESDVEKILTYHIPDVNKRKAVAATLYKVANELINAGADERKVELALWGLAPDKRIREVLFELGIKGNEVEANVKDIMGEISKLKVQGIKEEEITTFIEEVAQAVGLPKPGEVSPSTKLQQVIDALTSPDQPVLDVVTLWGILTRNPLDNDFWRLYLNIEFSEYLEFSKDSVVYQLDLASEQNPLGGTIIWISRSATIYQTSAASRVRQASFLQGNITANQMPQPAMGMQSPLSWAWQFGQVAPMMARSPGCSGVNGCQPYAPSAPEICPPPRSSPVACS